MRYVHFQCYENAIILKGELPHLMAPDDETAYVSCSKKCYHRVAKTTQSNCPISIKIPWEKDGRLGHNDPVNSFSILFDWMSTGNNYERFRSGRGAANGVTKQAVCEQIAATINQKNLKVVRSWKQVLSKIKHLEDCFKKAHDWAQGQTGAGVQETDPAGWRESVLQRFPHYYELLPIMVDRASARPPITNEELSDNDDNEHDNEHDEDDNTPESELLYDYDNDYDNDYNNQNNNNDSNNENNNNANKNNNDAIINHNVDESPTFFDDSTSKKLNFSTPIVTDTQPNRKKKHNDINDWFETIRDNGIKEMQEKKRHNQIIEKKIKIEENILMVKLEREKSELYKNVQSFGWSTTKILSLYPFLDKYVMDDNGNP